MKKYIEGGLAHVKFKHGQYSARCPALKETVYGVSLEEVEGKIRKLVALSNERNDEREGVLAER